MTTVIAVSNSLTMFADSLCDDAGRKTIYNKKIQQIYINWHNKTVLEETVYNNKGHGISALVGFSGETQCGVAFTRWCEGGLSIDARPSISDHPFSGVLLLSNRKIFYFCDLFYPVEICEPYYIIGSGRDYAYGALATMDSDNLDYHKALSISTSLDNYSSFPIYSLTLK